MQSKKNIIITVIGIIILFVVISAAFIVDETKQAIITRFGKPVGEAITAPGIHFKVPFLEEANFFDKRFLEWDGDANQIPTKGKKFIWVDTYARWRISDPLLFFQRVRDERGAQARLDDILDGETRNAIANHELHEIVRNTNRKADEKNSVLTDFGEKDVVMPEIKIGRENITREIFNNASVRTLELGNHAVTPRDPDKFSRRIRRMRELARAWGVNDHCRPISDPRQGGSHPPGAAINPSSTRCSGNGT